jgi:hypothetical protein
MSRSRARSPTPGERDPDAPYTIIVRVEDMFFSIPIAGGLDMSPSAPLASAAGSSSSSSASASAPAQAPAPHVPSTRWLAHAALARYADATKAGGAVRCREVVPTLPALGIANVSLEWSGEFVGPDLPVSELRTQLHSKGGQDALDAGVRVHLVQKPGPAAKSRHDTTIVSPLWHSLAYSFSKGSREHAEVLLTSFREEAAKKAAEAAAAKERESADQMVKLGRLLQSDAEDPETLEKNFLFDFSNVRVNQLTQNPDVARRLRRNMWTWYGGICDAFRHFSGGSSKGSTASMQKQEVVHMLMLCQGIDIVKERKLLDKLFEKANSGRTGDSLLADDKDTDSLSRYELLEFLAMLADIKYGQEVDTKSGELLGPASAFTRFMNEKLGPLIAKLNAGPVRAALKEVTMHKFLLPRLPGLMKVYQYYATLDDEPSGGGGGGGGPKSPAKAGRPGSAAGAGKRGGPGGPGGIAPPAAPKKANLMNLEEFILLLEHSGLLDDVTVMTTAAREGAVAQLKTTKASLTAQEVRETFSGVQREDDESGLADAAEELSYGEFLEAIGRTALAKWGDALGLKYVTDPRMLAKGQSAQGVMSQDVFARAERTLVRSLLMWAYMAVGDLEAHIGRPVSAPVQYDVQELARLVAVGLSDQAAASASRGQARNMDLLEAEKNAESEGSKGKVVDAGPGVEVFASHHPLKPKSAFGAFKMPSDPPVRASTAIGGRRA